MYSAPLGTQFFKSQLPEISHFQRQDCKIYTSGIATDSMLMMAIPNNGLYSHTVRRRMFYSWYTLGSREVHADSVILFVFYF